MSTILFTAQNTPSAPTAGKIRLFIDSADNSLKSIDENGTVTIYTPSTVEQIQDTVGAFISAGSSKVSVTYNDIGNVLSIDINPGNIDHTLLQNVGTHTHAQIDSHISSVANPHNVTKSQVGLSNVQNLDQTNPVNITQDSTHRFVTDTEKTTWNSKQDAITGAATTITNSNLTASKVLISDVSGKVAVSTTTATELGYISGITSSVQSQIDGKQNSDSTLTALSSYDTNGLLTQTSTDTFTGRSIEGTSGNISVTNGNGVLGNPTVDLVNTGTPGTYGSASSVPVITTDSKGRTTSVTNTSIQISESQVTNLTTDLSNKVTANSAITGATKTKITYDSKGLITSGSDASLDDLSDVVITNPQLNEYLGYNGVSWVNQYVTQTVNAGAGVSYFLSGTSSGINGYDLMSKTPDAAAETDESVSVTNQTLLLDGYIADSDVGSTSIDAGVWEFNWYAYASNVSGNTYIKTEVYKRTSGGTETLLFSVNTDIINFTSINLTSASSVQPAFSCNSTDRILIKIYAVTDSVTPVTVHLVHSGSDHYSHFHTPLVTRHNDLSGLQGGSAGEYYHLTQTQNSGLTTGSDTSLHYHSSDRNRANHTGTQTSSTISDFNEAAQDAVGSSLSNSSSVSFTYNDAANTITATVISGGVDHDSLSGLQGGTASEYNHLTNAEYTGTGTGVFVKASSPALTGTPTAPTAISSTNNTQIATTAYVKSQLTSTPPPIHNLTDAASAGVSTEFARADHNHSFYTTGVTPATYGSATQVGQFSVNAQGQITGATNVNISVTSSAISDFNEAAQDAVGGILTDSTTIDFTYNDAANTITAAVLPGGVDHNSLLNGGGNTHIDHSAVSIIAGTGLSGGGTIASSRTLNIANTGVTAGTYGSVSQNQILAINAQGQITSASSTNIVDAPLTGFTASPGTVADTDTIIQAIQKLAGKDNELNCLVNTSTVSNTSNVTLGNITDLRFPVVSGKTYQIELKIVFSTASTTTGIALTIGTPNGANGTLSALVNMAVASDGTAAGFTGSITSFGDTVTGSGVQTSNTRFMATISGSFICTASGDLVPQFRSEVNGSSVTVYPGSFALIREF